MLYIMTHNEFYINELCKFIMSNDKLAKKYDFSHIAQKYKLETIITDIFWILESGSQWRNYRGELTWQSLYRHYNFLSKNKVFFNFYSYMLSDYYETNSASKLKHSFTDTSIFYNKYGTNKKNNIDDVNDANNINQNETDIDDNDYDKPIKKRKYNKNKKTGNKNKKNKKNKKKGKEKDKTYVARNSFYKGKNACKLSLIVDSNGIAYSSIIKNAALSDSTILHTNIDNLLIDPETKKYENCNRHKQNMYADSGYDTKAIRNRLTELGYLSLIPQNKRNIKDPKKIIKFTDEEKKKYKKRTKIENIFAVIKMNRRLGYIYESKIINFVSFIYLSLIKIITPFLNK